MVVVSDDDEGFSTGSGSTRDDFTTEYETDFPDNIDEESDSECDENQEKQVKTQENLKRDDAGDRIYSVKKLSTSSMYNNGTSDKQRKVSTLSAVEGSPASQNSALPKRKLSFYLDFDPTATPPPSPRTPKQSETDKPNLF